MKNKHANDRRGLLAGGNWIIDQVKMIDVYPQPEQLANIRGQSQGTGGAAYNVLVDLAQSGTPFPLFARRAWSARTPSVSTSSPPAANTRLTSSTSAPRPRRLRPIPT